HPFHKITEAGIETSKKSFPLGKNEFTYFSKAHLKDEAKFPFNVYDSEAPYIIFRNQTGHETRDITVEANAHYGFKVTSKTLPQLKQGSYADDLCDKKPSFEYIGPDFFLLTKLKQEQYAPWKTADTAPRGYNALSSADIQRVVESELEFLGTDSYLPKRTAALDPYRTVEFSNLDPNDPRENFATARHLFSIVTNDAVNELLADNTKVVPTADLKLGSNLTDQITLKEIDILGMSKLDQEKITSMMEKEDPLKLSNISPEIKQTLLELSIEPKFVEGEEVDFVNFDLFGQLFDSLISSTPQGRPNIITATEPAQPNVFVDYQNVTVVDTIPPNILVTEDIAIEVNKTNIALTNHPTLKPNGCTGDPLIKSTIKCELEIRPPALFDIADPFPTLFTNVTDSNFDELKKANLQASFYHGVTFIAWKAVDYSNNTETAIQIVNIKIEGENVPPEANPIEEDAFSTVPQQITLIANNTDLDPLKFTIRQDPDKGIIDTPIDAVFLNKFTLPGVISQLTGITNEVNSTDGNPIPGVYFTDFRNQRVLFQNTNDDVQVSFEIAESLTQQPEGISLTPDGTFMIGDWKGNKIVEVNYTGNLIKQFDIEGLFSQTGVHNEKMLTVDEDSTIYVSDSINGKITKLFDFDAFSNIQGIESNSNSVFVADQSQNKVYHFNTTGRFVENIPNQYFVNATDVTIDSDNYIYVLDIGSNTIQRFNPTLDDTKEFGNIGNGLKLFDSPQGITSNGTQLFVADTGNHKIKKIQSFDAPYIESYDNSTNDWQNVGNFAPDDIQIFLNDGAVIFSSETSVTTENQLYRDIGMDIPDSFWSAQFELDVDKPTGQNKDNLASVFLWLLTNNTHHPQTDNPQDSLGIVYENKVLKFYNRHNITTSSITIVDTLKDNTQY
ncbi:MAG: hypothetical protein GTO02_01485, partial [Candidatus Dadabacteria bacterium]|nr:hypothetical protein [Candidatus Dadabacteria bacterium]